MKKEFISEQFNRKIEWVEGGRIVHRELSTNQVLGIEDYSKAALSKIMHFLKDSSGYLRKEGLFNKSAKDYLNGIDGFRVEKFGDIFIGVIADKKNATNKINRSVCRYGEITKIYLPVDQNWKPNTRYEITFEADGSVQFDEFEPILPENLNKVYSEPLLNIHICVK